MPRVKFTGPALQNLLDQQVEVKQVQPVLASFIHIMLQSVWKAAPECR